MNINNLKCIGVAAGLLLSSCSGDGRPFTEAVEANDLQLKSITVVQPASLLPDLVVNPGAQVSFTLNATNFADLPVDLLSGNRRWIVDNPADGPAVASIDDNGNLLALSNGVASVRVVVGAVASNTFEVEVRTEVLQSIDSIVARDVETDGSLERCLPQDYRAIGKFAAIDGTGTESLRAIPSVRWSVENSEVGTVAKPVEGFVSVTGVNLEPLILTVEADDVAPFSRSITVEDTLREIRIDPMNSNVNIGQTLPLLALATYELAGEERTDVDITESVQWFAEEDNTVLRVGNTVLNKGIVTPLATGNQVVSASCGNLEQQKTVIVSESDTTSDSSITIEPVVLSLAADSLGRQLRVSTGSSFDDDALIEAADVNWSVIDNFNVASITLNGFITPLAPGTVTVQAVSDGIADDIIITVTLQ